MKNGDKTNKLLFELPDYIKGNIDDLELKNKIESEIKNNPDFRKEYEDLKDSFSFLDTAGLQEPPDHYFSTLLPKINERLEKKKKVSEVSFWERIFSYWKFAIPLVPILLIFLIFKYDVFYPGKNLKIEENNNNVIVHEKTNNDKEITDDKELAVVQEDTNIESERLTKQKSYRSSYYNNYEESSNNYETSDTDNSSFLDEYLDEIENYYDDNSDYSLEDDFNDLSSEQQDEIIQELMDAEF